MCKNFFSLVFLILVFTINLSYAQEESSTSPIKVEQILFGTGIENREATGVDTVFSEDIGKVYCWCLVTGTTAETKISFVWSYQDKEMARVEVPVRSIRWRTWSYKTIRPEWTGNWKVEILDEAGKVLESASFQIQ